MVVTVLTSSCIHSFSPIPTLDPKQWFYFSLHLTDKEVEAQRGDRASPGHPGKKEVAVLGLGPRVS